MSRTSPTGARRCSSDPAQSTTRTRRGSGSPRRSWSAAWTCTCGWRAACGRSRRRRRCGDETRVPRERADGPGGGGAGARRRPRSRRSAVLRRRARRPRRAGGGARRSRRGDRFHGCGCRALSRRGVRAGGSAPRRRNHGVASAGGGSATRGGAGGRRHGVRRKLLDRGEPVLSSCGPGRGAVPGHGLRRLYRGSAPFQEARRTLRYRLGAAPAARGAVGARGAGGEHPGGPHSRRAPGGTRFRGGRGDRQPHRTVSRELRGGGARGRPLARRLGKARRVCLRGRAGRDPRGGKARQAMTQRVEWLRGCGTALVTPFAADGRVDEVRMHALVERQIAGGVKLLVPCGTTGEAMTMTPEEQVRVMRITVETGRGRARVLAGGGSNSTAVTIERAKAARVAGVDGVLVVAPYYNKPTQAGLIAHFKAVADGVAGLPLVLYNVPGRTSSNIQAPTVLSLAREVETIAGVKEASNDLTQIMAILRERPDGFKVLSGDDAVTLPLIALGAEGIISVVSNEVPDLMARMTEFALQGSWGQARELHYRLLPLMEANFIESNPGPVKAALALMGLLEEQLRLPLVPVQEKTRSRLREVLQELGALQRPAHVAA